MLLAVAVVCAPLLAHAGVMMQTDGDKIADPDPPTPDPQFVQGADVWIHSEGPKVDVADLTVALDYPARKGIMRFIAKVDGHFTNDTITYWLTWNQTGRGISSEFCILPFLLFSRPTRY